LVRGFLLAASGFIVTACTGLQPFPNAARPGDTVMLAVGSPDGMTVSNTTAQYVPDSDPFNPVDLSANIRSIFKMYPDRTSPAWLTDVFVDGIPRDTGHGAWLTVVAIDLPDTLLPGTGNVQMTTTAAIGSTATPIDGLDIPLEILPGIGQPARFPYDVLGARRNGNLAKLEPLPQVVVRPPIGGLTPTYGAVELKLNVPLINIDGTPAPDAGFTVVSDDMGRDQLNSQLQTSWARNGDEITIIFVSPIGTMKAWEARISVVVFPNANTILGIPGTIIDTSKPPPSFVSIKYYDVDGNLTTGPSPAVTVENSGI
jgi:hypothetical protein